MIDPLNFTLCKIPCNDNAGIDMSFHARKVEWIFEQVIGEFVEDEGGWDEFFD